MTEWTKTDANGNPDFSSLFEEKGVVVLLRGKNNFGDRIYSYVKIALTNLEQLQHSIRNGLPFNASDFGEVVAAGTGEPTDQVKAEIAAQYPMLDQKPAAPAAPSEPLPKKAWDEY